MLQIAIVNGPNLNLIGTREVDVYGGQSLEEFYKVLQQEFPQVSFEFYQSNVEGEIINFLHSCRGRVKGIVFNGGAYTHTSIAIPDAIAAINIPTIEVHISNIYAREEFRKHSYTAAKCVGCITGLGLRGYALATQYFVDTLIAP
ncbi:MAG: type II 3-dehydroquinate dehydratase [Flavipsychrobacter sp.]|jgi:3-dehydroquinate dehydratase-2